MPDNHISLSLVNQWTSNSLDMLYDRYYRALVVYADTFVSDSDAAEDVVQDFFASMWQRKPTFETIIQLRVYLYSSVRNRSLNHLRNLRKTDGTLRINALDDDVMPMESIDENALFGPEVYRMLLEMVESLPQRQREVFMLAMEGRRNAEIAEQLEISLNTVKVLKRRALTTLKEKASDKNLSAILVVLVAIK